MAKKRSSRGSSKSSSKKNASARARPSLLKRLLRWSLTLAFIAAIIGGGALAGIFYYYGQDLPEVIKREDFRPPQMTRVYASGGELIAELATPGGGKRTVVPMSKIPEHVRWSFMAAEDADFMTHGGIDYLGMVRAFYYAIAYDTGLKGTSTITQQVVKNLILSPERSISRKVREIILARELEQQLSKEDILWLYLNDLYMGHGVNGVEEAAKLYFGKPVMELKIHESAVLAGITQSPERLSPRKHPERALKRRAFVLRQLRDKGFINEAAYREADAEPLKLAAYKDTKPHLNAAPYFTEYIRKTLIEKYGKEKVYGGGLRVYTTLDLKKQLAADQSLRQGLRDYDARHNLYRPIDRVDAKKIGAWQAKQAKNSPGPLKTNTTYKAVVLDVDPALDHVRVGVGAQDADLLITPRTRILGEGKQARALDKVLKKGDVIEVHAAGTNDEGQPQVKFKPGPQASFVMMDPKNRHVLVLSGGYDFDENHYDHATQAKRQTGSTFKPFVYAAAIEDKQITPATLYLDTPKTFKLGGNKTYTPRNSDGKSRGQIRIREGIGASRNAVAVRVLDELGTKKAISFAERIGITTPLVDNITLVMGSSSLTMMEMINAYSTLANQGMLETPRYITRIETMTGEAESFATSPRAVIAPEIAYLITDLMIAVTQGYTDSSGKRRQGTASSVNKLEGMAIAGKTGTTNEARDGWFMGFTPYYVGGAWMGYDDNAPLGKKEYGSKVAGPIWLGAMRAAHKGLKPKRFSPPKTGITTARIHPTSGKLVNEGGIVETFIVGTAPTEYHEESVEQVNEHLLNQFTD